MNTTHKNATARLAAYSTIIGALLMLTGAILKIVSGVDLDQALASGSVSSYLTKAAEVQSLLVTNLTFWIVGVFFLGIAGIALSNLCDHTPVISQLVKLAYGTGVPLAIASFVAWIALVVQGSAQGIPSDSLGIEIVGLFISRADWIATVLVVGLGPALISLAGHGKWMPPWLSWYGILPAIAGILTSIAMFTYALTSYGFLIVPIGLIWMIATGIVLFGKLRSNPFET